MQFCPIIFSVFATLLMQPFVEHFEETCQNICQFGGKGVILHIVNALCNQNRINYHVHIQNQTVAC